MKALIYATDGTGTLQLTDLPDPAKPQKGEVLIEHTMVGVNHTDLQHMRHMAANPPRPNTIAGLEGIGYVAACGEGVEGFTVGMRVGYATGPIGAFCERRVIAAHHLVSLPNEVPDAVAAALLYKGMAARYLTMRTFRVFPGSVVVIRGVTGAVGRLICQFAQYLQGTVIGTVGSDANLSIAKTLGCAAVHMHDDPKLLESIQKISKKMGASVLYDTVGGPQGWSLLPALGSLGVYVSVGDTAGALPPLDIKALSSNSLFLTRPRIADYKSARLEHVISAFEVFQLYTDKVLQPFMGGDPITLADIPAALETMAQHRNTGAMIARLK